MAHHASGNQRLVRLLLRDLSRAGQGFAVAVALLALLALATPASAEQFWAYQHVGVSGTLTARANVSAYALRINRTAVDQENMARHIPQEFEVLDASGSAVVEAAVSASFVDGCRTTAAAKVSARTAYALSGDNDNISVSVQSRRSHSNTVIRGGGGPGSYVTTESEYDVPQPKSLTFIVPVALGGHLGGTVTLRSFTIARTDSSLGSEGATTCSWEWYHDRNSNQVIDPTEIPLAAQVGIVGPNGSFGAPSVSFHAPRAYHILRVTCFASSEIMPASAACAFPASESSNTAESVQIHLTLSPP